MQFDPMPQLVQRDKREGLVLDAVAGSRVDLLQWRSRSAGHDSLVSLPIYLDSWAAPGSVAGLTTVVVHVHGKERDAAVAWADMAAARARLPAHEQQTVLVVAPQFFNGLDKSKFEPCQDVGLLVWKGNGWGEGASTIRRTSPRTTAAGISSFEALDALVCHFANAERYSSLTRIVLSGHSLGAQLVQRYSILGCAAVMAARKVEVKYIVMNPASFLYFSPERDGPHAAGMNEYKYGFDNLSTRLDYPGLLHGGNPQRYLVQMLQRTVHFIHGEADRGVGDDRPEAMAQGSNRAERARNYHRHLAQMQTSIGMETKRWTVDWVARTMHDGRAMATSNAAITRIFASAA